MKHVLVLALVLSSTLAHADDRATAERYFHAGAKAYAAQNFAAAATDFDEAYKAAPLPEIAFSAAQAYRRLYRVDPQPRYVQRAVELYRVYLDKVKTGGRGGDAADSLGEMLRELDRLGASAAAATAAPQAEHTRLGVSVTLTDQHGSDASTVREIGDLTPGELTKGLAATIDGKPLEPFALVDVTPTDHVLAVTADGYLPVEKKVRAVTGQSQLIEVALSPRPAKVAVATEAGARIEVDGRAAGNGPRAALELPAGKHLLLVMRRGRKPFGRELEVTRGQELALAAPLQPTARRRAVPWVLGGAGVVAAGAVTTGILALVHDHRARDLRDAIDAGNRPPSDADAYDHEVSVRDRYATATWLLGGTAFVAGTVGFLLYWFDTPESSGVHLAPVAGGGSTGAALTGRF